MFKKFRYIITLLPISAYIAVFGQELPADTSDYNGNYLYVIFNSNIISNDSVGTEPDQGDYYRVKYKNPDIQLTKDASLRLVEGTNISPVSKDSLVKYDITELSDISFNFFKSSRECWLRTSDIITKMTGDTLYVVSMTISAATVNYESNQVCENSPEPLIPSFSEESGKISYTSPDGLVIDQYSGKIAPLNQRPGKFTVQFSSNYCLENYEDTITILPKPSFTIEKNRRICEGNELTLSPETEENVSFTWSTGEQTRSISVTNTGSYSILAENEYGCLQRDTILVDLKTIEIEQIDFSVADADCYTPGSINLKSLEIREGLSPYIYSFKNTVTGQITSEASMLREGDYVFTIEDAEGCITTFGNIISIRKDCLNDRPVFSPNTDGRDDDYYIPYEGEALVYDRNGMVRHRFMAPDYWNGKDGNGNPLPMGSYLIVVGKEVINITIIK